MKRFWIVLALCLAVGLVVLIGCGPRPQVGTQAVTPRVGGMPPVYYVIASDAPASMRRGGPNTWVCSGTNDEVQIQAAVDAATDTDGDASLGEVGEGAVVQLSPGIFVVSQAAGVTSVDGYCDLDSDNPSGACRAEASTVEGGAAIDFQNGSFSDLAVGQVVRFSGGQEGGGDSLEDQHEDFIGTITALDGSSNYFDVSERISEDFDDHAADRLTWTVMHSAIVLKPSVILRGSGRRATTIQLADSQNCNMIQTEVGSNHVSWQIENLTLDGNETNQTTANLSNGLILNDYAWDVHLLNIAVINTLGDLCHVNYPWGLRFRNGWLEHSAAGRGLVLGDASNALVSGVKIRANGGEALVLRGSGCAAAKITGCNLGSDSNVAIRMIASPTNCLFSDNYIDGTGGGIVVDGNGHVIVGNEIYPTASTIGIDVSTQFDLVIAGNHFVGTLAPAIQANQSNNGGCNIYGNVGGVEWTKEIRHIWVENGEGATVDNRSLVCRSLGGAGDEFVIDNTQGSSLVWGILVCGNAADDAMGRIQTRGFQQYGPVEGDEVYAVGNELCVSNNNAGALEVAGAGDTIIAICMESRGAGGAGIYRGINIVLVEPYIK